MPARLMAGETSGLLLQIPRLVHSPAVLPFLGVVLLPRLNPTAYRREACAYLVHSAMLLAIGAVPKLQVALLAVLAS